MKSSLRDPWLVQRCKAQEFGPNLKTSEYLAIDYMGAAEFEWGALPEWQREMNRMMSHLVIEEVTIGDKTYFYMIDQKRKDEYLNIMVKIIEETIKTKMGIRLRDKETLWVGKKKDKPMFDQPHAPFRYDCWWDITNTAAFARSREILENMKVTISNSVRFMDSQKEKQ